LTVIADQLPDAIDDDDDWLGKMLAEDGTRTVNPAPPEAWKSPVSPVAQLRQELVDELKPTTHSSVDGPADVEPPVGDLPTVDNPIEPAVHERAAPSDEPTPPDPDAMEEIPPPVMAEESLASTDPVPVATPLSSDEVATLMSPTEEETSAAEPPVPTMPPIDLSGLTDDARAVCPAGKPKPTIDLKAMQKSKGAASDQVARLFGEKSAEPPPTSSTESDRPALTFEEPVVAEKKLPRVLQILDEATSRVRKAHASLPTVAGLVGVALVGHGTLIAILATLGWI
jgi:hypothetical protein